ncbi:hypothetical protein [Parvicella tangerina]|uniref:Uncharacterized protein n=1 Tax=Parvicella tangerina TaxID=2829795 RepID=A0A916JLW9_9FLAO|nr:hypothetical protein [Parvicella tangerina]CAG5080960.1 hypothetical protein CRYO30217_01496 [Parvicella tangerina]
MKIKYLIIVPVSILALGCSEQSVEQSEEPAMEESGDHDEETVEETQEDTDPRIESIDMKVAAINNRHDWDDGLLFEVHESTEGGEVMMYFDGEQVAYIEAHHFGEMGQVWNKYYLEEEKLIFVKESDISYSHPFYAEDELGTPEIDTMNNYSYFENDVLFRRIEDGDCGAPFADDYKLAEQERILKQLDKLMVNLEK